MPSRLPDDFSIGAMTRDEASVLESWAAAEAWNPGLNDIDVAWGFDSEAFIALRRGDELVGGGTIVSYRGRAGFMGLFIVRSDHRRRGLGALLWHERLRRLRARLRPGAPIGMDGVFDMVPFYQKGGFTLLHRDLRYQGVAVGRRDAAAVPLERVDFARLEAYDRQHVQAPRVDFLRAWLGQVGGLGTAVVDDGGTLRGYGFLRPCRQGFKVGPAFADDANWGELLLHNLLALVRGEPVQIDVPEPNEAARRFVEGLGWSQPFGCARMVNGPRPRLPVARIFGVTSFEFG